MGKRNKKAGPSEIFEIEGGVTPFLVCNSNLHFCSYVDTNINYFNFNKLFKQLGIL